MSGPLAAAIHVTPAQQSVLTALVRRPTCPQALALRARIILAGVAGQRNEPPARQPGCTPKTVRKWRARWAAVTARLLAVDDDMAGLARAVAVAPADALGRVPQAPSPPSRSSKSSTWPAARRGRWTVRSPLGRGVSWRTKRSRKASSAPSPLTQWGAS